MDGRWGTGRVEAFGDGVFAIAITLLILDIRVPLADFNDLWRGIANQWPGYLGYVTSFLTIGALWLLHHGVFRRLEYVDNRVMRLNLLVLMAVAFLPFPTRLMAEAIRESDAERVAVIVYGVTLVTISLLFAAMWEAAVRDRSLLQAGVTDAEIVALRRVAGAGRRLLSRHHARRRTAADGRGLRVPGGRGRRRAAGARRCDEAARPRTQSMTTCNHPGRGAPFAGAAPAPA